MKVVIIGNNVSGTTLAKALRDADANVEVDMYTDEPRPYYPRPKLIDYLEGKVQEKDMLFYQPEWYEKNMLGLHLNSKVEKIDAAGKKVLVKDIWVPYDALVLATGSSAFVPPFKGLPKKNVFTLRTMEDARNIKETAAHSKHAIVIGGGLLGLESARGICSSNPHLEVTILEYAEHLLMRQLDHEGAEILQAWIESTGAKVVTEAQTEEVLGQDSVTGVKLKDGRTIEGDMVIISAGARANLDLPKDAGLKVNRGIVVDSSLRTSDPNIYAIGDVSEFNGQVWAMIPPALDQARIAARRILGQPGPDYGGTVPSNTLKVTGLDLTSVGMVKSAHDPPEPGYEEIRAFTPDRSVYKKFVIKDGKLIGAILLGTRKEAVKVTKMVKDGVPIDAIKPKLSDPSYSFA
ncbi:MAG: NAD(P)/FAD-dependent oxidoreductase [Candidatus Thermoplasmatota archaeon]|nr:NAD(P)/FAD-dependent oxidoreductase [Candidatus Thermoplasmatota archaeon]